MEHLQYDPRTKHQIKNALYEHLYNPVNESFKDRLYSLAIRNTILGRYWHKSFTYKGEFYNADTEVPPRKKNRLHAQLRPEMDQYLQDLKELNEEELPYVLGFINHVLNSSNGLTDYLKVFPQSVHEPIRKLIHVCPCQSCSLAPEKVNELVVDNEIAIGMMKARMVANLLL